MRMIVLGPNGQLGTDILRAAAGRPRIQALPVTRHDLDVAELEYLADRLQALAFDVLVNCTSYHKTDEVEANATHAFRVNAHAVRTMAEVCHRKNARFVHVSTDYVFDGRRRQPYITSDCPQPINVYGASKAMGETLASMAHPDTHIVRVASLFGTAGASGKGGNFVETMIRLARGKGVVRVVDDMAMSPTYTADAAEMILRLLERGAVPGIYHAVNSGQATWYEFACEIIARAGIAARVEPITSGEYPTVARRPAYSVLDNSSVMTATDYAPHWSDALRRYLIAKGHITSMQTAQQD